MQNDSVILRWSFGSQDTVSLSASDVEKQKQTLWLGKLSILSFQRWFPDAQFYVLYNGDNFRIFQQDFEHCLPALSQPVVFIEQSTLPNPYHFAPRGVWWKWVPFRIDSSKNEIAIDTDIVCISKPLSWYKWLSKKEPILIAPERYERVVVNTCGDFWEHPLLRSKTPFNCGVVGQRAGFDFSSEFFDICHSVRMGETYNSMFITEQGAINLWARSLELNNRLYVLDFKANAWVRDFIYFMMHNTTVETVHAVTWHKNIIYAFREIFERVVLDKDYSQSSFLYDVLANATHLEPASRFVLMKQIGETVSGNELLLH